MSEIQKEQKDVHGLNSLNIFLSIGLMIFGFVGVFAMHSWVPFLVITGLLLAGQIVAASVKKTVEVVRSKGEWDFIASTAAIIAVAAIGILIVGITSAVERVAWFNLDRIPSILMTKEYATKYTTNNHRMFKLIREARNYKGPMMIREIDDRVYVRSGDWFPDIYTISAPKDAFYTAMKESANDPPGMPVIVEPEQ